MFELLLRSTRAEALDIPGICCMGWRRKRQLKSTTQAIEDETEIRYDLDVPAYDGLREEMDNCPRFLVLLVLPDEESKWLEQSPEQLLLRRCVYWLSLTGRPPTKSRATVRIAIPRANLFSVDALRLLLTGLQRKDDHS